MLSYSITTSGKDVYGRIILPTKRRRFSVVNQFKKNCMRDLGSLSHLQLARINLTPTHNLTHTRTLSFCSLICHLVTHLGSLSLMGSKYTTSA